jgi:hypothetical protein
MRLKIIRESDAEFIELNAYSYGKYILDSAARNLAQSNSYLSVQKI